MSSPNLPLLATSPARAIALAFALFAALVGAAVAKDASSSGPGVDACSLVPAPVVSKIVGTDMTVSSHSPPAVTKGATRSSCYYKGSHTSGFLTVTTFDTAATAQEHLSHYAAGVTAASGKVEADHIGADASSYITAVGGVAQMFVVHDNRLVAAGITNEKQEAGTWQVDRSRELAAAAVGKL